MKNNQIKLILFDIGGVLIDYSDVFRTVSIEQKFPREFIDKTFDKYDKDITIGKITPQELYLRCLNENGLVANKNYNFIDSWLRDYAVIKPTFDLIELLQQEHKEYKIGLFSNIYTGMVPEMMKRQLIPNINYNYTFLSCDIGMQKPDKQIYNYVLSITGFKTNQILFIDDKDDNIESAINIGFNTFKFSRQDPKESIIRLKEFLLI